MLTLIRTELLKLRSTRWPMILAVIALLATAVLALQPVLNAGRGAPSIGTIGATLGLLDAMTRGALVALVIGALVVTSEFRHSTITASLLQVPERAKLVTAKTAAAVLVGLALAVACFAIVLLMGAMSGVFQPELVNRDIALRAMGHILTFPVYALLGAGIGALLHFNQPLAVAVPAIWLVGLEGLVLAALPQRVHAWSIGGATAGLQNSGTLPMVLPVWLGAVALVAYGLILVSVGGLRVVRADIS
jgi:ABC-type transport system involved in multi-copper enzyme maturation permease subunit